jgi:hypothetical protein
MLSLVLDWTLKSAFFVMVLMVPAESVWAQQMCGQFPDVITAPSRKIGSHGCDSDRDGTVKDSKYCRCSDCNLHPELCDRKGDVEFCACDPSLQHCRPRPCIASGQCDAANNRSYYWSLDCNDYNRDRFPGNCETCGDRIDDNCNGSTTDCTGSDQDGDGFSPPQDCNDNNAQAYPGATEIPCNAIDEDCSGTDLCDGNPVDPDGDGFSAPADCNEGDASVYPGAPDPCGDNINSDCDPLGLDCPEDTDGDGYQADVDCDDTRADVHPGQFDLCGDGIDQDCVDGDRSCRLDQDRDGYDAMSVGGLDCNDLDSVIHPNGREICDDGKDQDCSGQDAICADFDRDGDGHGNIPDGGDDCDDTDDSVYPGAPEACGDRIDSNCDGAPDLPCPDNVDHDGDGFQSSAVQGADCNDFDSRISPLALEICGDAVDNNCNGLAEEACASPLDPNEKAKDFVNTAHNTCDCAAVEKRSTIWPSVVMFSILFLVFIVRRRRA